MEDTMPIVEQFTRELPVKLNDEEKRSRGLDLARAEQELQDFNERERKSKLADLKAREAEIKARIAKLSGIVVTGSEIRNVACRAEADFVNGRAFQFRNDTGERIGDRALREEERQPSLLPEGTEAIRASECGHLTAKQAGAIPKFCGTCVPAEPTPEDGGYSVGEPSDLSGDTSEPIPEGSLDAGDEGDAPA
jgi:hypothetical protein